MPRVYCGTYTSGRSTGIYTVYPSSLPKLVDSAVASNPSFLALSPDGRRLYAVHENRDSLNNGGAISAYAVNKKGRLRFLNRLLTGGNTPCYVSVHPSGKFVYAANYGGGSLSVYGLDAKGRLTGPLQTLQHSGKSVVEVRQSSPHVHAVVLSPDGEYLLVPDLGTDKVMVYRINLQTGMLAPASEPFMPVHAGAGPRHIAFHPNGKIMYLAEELSGTVGVFTYGEGKLKLMQTISTVPEDYKGTFSVADIHCSPDGRFVYASNRATANSLVIYKVDAADGILTVVGHQPVLGVKPRNFCLSPDGKELWVANQLSDEVVVFSRDGQTGLLADSGKRIAIPSPVCLIWAK
jgi:6-phosphogluconolactonase